MVKQNHRDSNGMCSVGPSLLSPPSVLSVGLEPGPALQLPAVHRSTNSLSSNVFQPTVVPTLNNIINLSINLINLILIPSIPQVAWAAACREER